MHVCHFEDRAEAFEPLTLTRPVFDLRCGIQTIAEKQRRYFGATSRSAIVRPLLAEWYQSEHPTMPVNGEGTFPGGDAILVNGRWLPPREAFAKPSASCVGMIDGSVAYVYLPARAIGAVGFAPLVQESLASAPRHDVAGRLLTYPWDLLTANAEELRRDCADRPPSASERCFNCIGPVDQLSIAPAATVEPMVVFDTTRGPIALDDGVVVSAFSRIEGPCWIGAGTLVFGAKIRGGVSIGPGCRVGGEVEASILHGHANKYHEGFLGHSYVGEWVNLGAGTHTSDLRNDYGEVSVIQHGEPVATGLTKVGSFLGDHTRTGLGTLLNTGSNLGAFCNLLPNGRLAPRYVPSFTSWWNGALREAFTLEQGLSTAEIAMQRRGVTLTESLRSLYIAIWHATADERRQAMRESEQRALRRSA
jgi:UDP-N-acetylglucosamine diphosphorylase/glucosamine-1-phosphate N-acetyltransferase